MGIRELLNAAADHLDRVGLHKGGFLHDDAYQGTKAREVPCCTLGAVRVVAGVYDDWANEQGTRELFTAGANAVERAHSGQDTWGQVSWWNDRPGTTKDDAVALLRRAAELAGE